MRRLIYWILWMIWMKSKLSLHRHSLANWMKIDLLSLSFPRKQESMLGFKKKSKGIPAFAGMTEIGKAV